MITTLYDSFFAQIRRVIYRQFLKSHIQQRQTFILAKKFQPRSVTDPSTDASTRLRCSLLWMIRKEIIDLAYQTVCLDTMYHSCFLNRFHL